jgi:hypothetical protein
MKATKWTKSKRRAHGKKIQATRRRNALRRTQGGRVRTRLQKLVRDAINAELKRLGLL